MSERIKYYENEINKINKILEKEDPKGENYGKLLAKIRAYEQLIADIRRAELDETIRLKEFDFKTAKESFEQEMASARFEKEREDAEEQARLNKQKLDNEIKKEGISAGKDVADSLIRGAFGFAGSIVAARVTWSIAKGILTEETAGNLMNSRVAGFLSKPNLFNFKF